MLHYAKDIFVSIQKLPSLRQEVVHVIIQMACI
jgi:hypothetical protein